MVAQGGRSLDRHTGAARQASSRGLCAPCRARLKQRRGRRKLYLQRCRYVCIVCARCSFAHSARAPRMAVGERALCCCLLARASPTWSILTSPHLASSPGVRGVARLLGSKSAPAVQGRVRELGKALSSASASAVSSSVFGCIRACTLWRHPLAPSSTL